MSGVTYPKTWVNGETLTHTDLNAQFTAVNTAAGAASGLATLNASSLVVEDPANATATKSAGKICKWGASEAFQCSALTATTLTSSIADGTAPLTVTSTTQVSNLTASAVGDGTNKINTKIINIGDWNMDTTDSVNVAHGLTLANIRVVEGTIRNDAGDTFYPIAEALISAGSAVNGAYAHANATNIVIQRLLNGFFDGSAAFDGTSYNRGWVVITYVS